MENVWDFFTVSTQPFAVCLSKSIKVVGPYICIYVQLEIRFRNLVHISYHGEKRAAAFMWRQSQLKHVQKQMFQKITDDVTWSTAST